VAIAHRGSCSADYRFLFETFIRPNIRAMAAPEIASRLDDYLYALRTELGDEAFPRPAKHYLDAWASDEHSWLRKYYPPNSDEPHFDLTPATEKAIDWLSSLEQRRFVGTESRLMTIFDLLRHLVEGTETDPGARISELERRKAEIEDEIRRAREGYIHLLVPLALRLRRPDSRAYGENFEAVRNWIRASENGARARRGFGYEIKWVDINHRQLGRNRIPDRISVATEADALKLIGMEKTAARFEQLRHSTERSFPILAKWLARKPFVALDHDRDWSRILAVLAWFRDHLGSNLYLRQLDIEGVDTKFIESRKPLLAELLAVILERTADFQSGASQTFEQRYGLKTKPPLVRFRALDQSLAIGGLLCRYSGCAVRFGDHPRKARLYNRK
jgi:hypothetical protein